ncbi:MAG: TlpA family protein disulfide reductase, partial [Bacteroidota bacterium]
MMKKIILLALFPMLILGCQNNKEKSGESDKKQQKQQKEEEADIQASTLIESGQPVPQFSFETSDGKEYSMAELEGNVVLLNFFATWCPTCMKEMPALQEQIWDKYKENDDFFMVSLGREHSMQEMKEFQEKKEYTFNFAPDTGRVIYGKFAEKYIPRNVLVDKKGEIIYECTGYDEEEFDKMLTIL